MILNTTSELIRLRLAGAVTTNQLEWNASWNDHTTTTFIAGPLRGASNDTTNVTIIGSPAASTQRQPTNIQVCNTDTIDATVTIEIFDGTNARRLVNAYVLPPKATLQWCPDSNWTVFPISSSINHNETSNLTVGDVHIQYLNESRADDLYWSLDTELAPQAALDVVDAALAAHLVDVTDAHPVASITGISVAAATVLAGASVAAMVTTLGAVPTGSAASLISLATSAATPLLLTNGQLVNVALTSQTVGATTLTIPDFASVVDTFVFTTLAQTLSNKTFVGPALGTPVSGVLTACTVKVELGFACSDQDTAITAGVGKLTFRMPHAMTLTGVRASVKTAPTDASIIIDINESGTTVLSTKLSIDATEKTSTTAAVPAVISDAALADDAEMIIDFDQVGSTIAGTGVILFLIGTRT